jgi:NADH-quinone oxidoreductase subunit L
MASADGVFALLWLLIALPLASSAVLLLGGRRTDAWGHLLGAVTPLISFGLGLVMFVTLLGRNEEERAIGQNLYTWVEAGDFRADMGLLYDPLSALFVLLITGVGGIIHVYSIGYMAHDERRRRFFGYMNLFVAAMLLLVLADNYLALFLGWEGVGLASYLLIGFWLHKNSAAVAAKKAFIVNRVGDLGLAIGIMLMFATFGNISFAGVASGIGDASTGTQTAIGLLLLLGACGKSAQVPLQSWLLDAMEGPTPVSALIHAATMVTAGVYLIVRSGFIYETTDAASTAVVIVGIVTALFGAIIGCAKDDIKRALAGSTMSQIGYMMLAAGLGPAGYAFAIFHLLTHGFFKADLFLGSGSIMHALNDEVDMRRYGGLRKFLPITFGTFALGYLAIIGFPGLSGFWSKDKIIEAAFADNTIVGLAAVLGAGITAFYMTRVMLMTWEGEKRWAEDADPHESPKIMTVPLMILAALSAFGGLLLAGDWIVGFLEPAVGPEEHHDLPMPALLLTLIVLVVVAAGAALSWTMYGAREVPVTAPRGSVFTRAARADLYGDAFNEAVFMRPGIRLTSGLVRVEDNVIDGTVNGTAATISGLSSRLRRAQNGFVRTYALTMTVGAAIVGTVIILGRLG